MVVRYVENREENRGKRRCEMERTWKSVRGAEPMEEVREALLCPGRAHCRTVLRAVFVDRTNKELHLKRKRRGNVTTSYVNSREYRFYR